VKSTKRLFSTNTLQPPVPLTVAGWSFRWCLETCHDWGWGGALQIALNIRPTNIRPQMKPVDMGRFCTINCLWSRSNQTRDVETETTGSKYVRTCKTWGYM